MGYKRLFPVQVNGLDSAFANLNAAWVLRVVTSAVMLASIPILSIKEKYNSFP